MDKKIKKIKNSTAIALWKVANEKRKKDVAEASPKNKRVNDAFKKKQETAKKQGKKRGLYSPPTFHKESIWNPYHSRWIPPIPHGICFG